MMTVLFRDESEFRDELLAQLKDGAEADLPDRGIVRVTTLINNTPDQLQVMTVATTLIYDRLLRLEFLAGALRRGQTDSDLKAVEDAGARHRRALTDWLKTLRPPLDIRGGLFVAGS